MLKRFKRNHFNFSSLIESSFIWIMATSVCLLVYAAGQLVGSYFIWQSPVSDVLQKTQISLNIETELLKLEEDKKAIELKEKDLDDKVKRLSAAIAASLGERTYDQQVAKLDKKKGLGGRESTHGKFFSKQNTSAKVKEDFENLLTRISGLPLQSPVAGDINSSFGYRHSPFSRRIKFHEGIDIDANKGSKVLAAGAGKILRIKRDSTYGLYIDIDHGGELITRYAHLSKAIANLNDEIKAGDVIGLVGSTGRSTGPHLHYEVRYRDVPKDPESFFRLAKVIKRII